MAEETNTAPAPDAQRLSDDDLDNFFKIKNDSEPVFEPEPKPEPEPETKSSGKETDAGDDDESILSDYELLAEVSVETIDMLANIGCQFISGERVEAHFEVTAAKRKRMQKPLALIFKNTKVETNPYVLVVFLVLITYAPMFMKAINMRKQKEDRKKMHIVGAPIPPPKYAAGRPDAAEAERRRQEQLKYERELAEYEKQMKEFEKITKKAA